MTARDASRARHPSSGGPTPTPPGGATLRARRTLTTIVAAVAVTILLPLLAHLLPYAATILAVWILGLVALVAVWAGLSEACQRWRARRFDRHTAQALRVVE